MISIEDFQIELEKLLIIDIEYFDSKKNFMDLYNAGESFFYVSLYVKRYKKEDEHYKFVVNDDKVAELRAIYQKTNEEIDKLIHEVYAPNCSPNFAYFNRVYWDLGYEMHISKRCKKEEEEKERKAYQESGIGKYNSKNGYSPCEGCLQNCKRCQYGDDGNYSKYDVYSPSELV